MQPKELFANFKLLTLLGEGAYAKVWKAHDTRDEREVAIKILHAHLASQENIRTRFLREADVQTKLYHPNIVKVFEVVEDHGSVGMVMELIEGLTLADAIALQKQMPFDQIQRIMDQILDAVGYAHSHQIVHRDLKPANILMLGDGTVKVSDFGIARLLHTPGAGVRTRTGMALGTSYYMSPEQVQGRKDLDHRSDIYALGCILYELLVGHPMFFEFEQQTDDPDFLIKTAHVQLPVPDPGKGRSNIPAGVISVLTQVLAKNPEDRFDECAEFRVELKRAFHNTYVSSSNTINPVIDDETLLFCQWCAQSFSPLGVLVELGIQPGPGKYGLPEDWNCPICGESAPLVCPNCDYEYNSDYGDPENGIQPGTSIWELPEDWACPVCGQLNFNEVRKDLQTESNIQNVPSFKYVTKEFGPIKSKKKEGGNGIWSNIFFLIISLVFVFGGGLMLSDGDFKGIFVIAFFGLNAIICIWDLIKAGPTSNE